MFQLLPALLLSFAVDTATAAKKTMAHRGVRKAFGGRTFSLQCPAHVQTRPGLPGAIEWIRVAWVSLGNIELAIRPFPERGQQRRCLFLGQDCLSMDGDFNLDNVVAPLLRHNDLVDAGRTNDPHGNVHVHHSAIAPFERSVKVVDLSQMLQVRELVHVDAFPYFASQQLLHPPSHCV